MISYYKTCDNMLTEITEAENGCWVSVTSPTQDEIDLIINEFGLDAGFVRSSLDEEESSRIEIEDEQTLVIVDYAVTETDNQNAIFYYTMPMGIILTPAYFFTISLKENIILREMCSGQMKSLKTQLKTQFLLNILLRIAMKFLQYLKQIDKLSYFTEKQLQRSMKNKELIQLLDLQKSLVYFSSSLKSNEVTLEKILRGRIIKLYEDDQDLLEDVLIEVKQAIEMSGIYSSILSGMTETFASVISNNLNIVMKRLTVITILMAIPTIIFSFYGMNVDDLPMPTTAFSLGISAIATLGIWFILRKAEK